MRYDGKTFLSAIDCADIVVTDRLHAGIAAFLLGKEVFLLDNSYGKLSSVYDHSLKEFKNVHFAGSAGTLADGVNGITASQ